jgi:hypothetical protein
VKVGGPETLRRVADAYASIYDWHVAVREGAFHDTEGAPTAGPLRTMSTRSFPRRRSLSARTNRFVPHGGPSEWSGDQPRMPAQQCGPGGQRRRSSAHGGAGARLGSTGRIVSVGRTRRPGDPFSGRLRRRILGLAGQIMGGGGMTVDLLARAQTGHRRTAEPGRHDSASRAHPRDTVRPGDRRSDLTLGVAVRLRDKGRCSRWWAARDEPQCLWNALASRAADQADELLELAGMLARAGSRFRLTAC